MSCSCAKLSHQIPEQTHKMRILAFPEKQLYGGEAIDVITFKGSWCLKIHLQTE